MAAHCRGGRGPSRVTPCGPPRRRQPLHETYHGVYINTIYTVRCEVVRGALSRNAVREAEFMVETRPREAGEAHEVGFRITPESLDNAHTVGRSKTPCPSVPGVNR